jgi:hypothetical protein
MGCFSPTQRLCGNPSGKPVSPPARDSKVPKPRQNLQFERPWDRLVPAKSVRKLTALIVLSKKFLVSNGAFRKGAVECAVLSVSGPIAATTTPLRTADTTAPENSLDSAAGLFGFSSRKQSHDDSDDNENCDRNADIERGDQPRTGRRSGRSRRRRRCVFRREHSLHVL